MLVYIFLHRYKLVDLKGAGIFSIGVKYSVCLDSANCQNETILFDNLQVPKSVCELKNSLTCKSYPQIHMFFFKQIARFVAF